MKLAEAAPPRFALRLLDRFSGWEDDYGAAGDFEEYYRALAAERGLRHARRACWKQVLSAFPGYLKNTVIWSHAMLKHYFRVARRNLLKSRAFSVINIVGLAIGMACALLIVFWVRDEVSYDQFHVHKSEIYRVTAVGKDYQGFSSPAPFAPAVVAEIPGVTEAVRVGRIFRGFLRAGGQTFYEDNGICADPALFKIFTFPLTRGTPETVLAGPSRVVLSESLAKKYFGSADPINKTLVLEGRWPLTVGGVMADVPSNSHLRFDFVVAFKFVEDGKWWGMDWGDFNFMTYIRTAAGRDEKALNQKLNQLAIAHKCPQVVYKEVAFAVQRLDEIYLNPLPGGYDIPLGNKKYVYLFAAIALFISLIAGINFINLTTARAEKRAKEVGLRKVVGAGRKQIVVQFFGESTLITLLSLGLAVALARIAMPAFNALTGKELAFRILDPGVLLSLGGIACFVGLLAGGFPSFYLSSFSPAHIFKARAVPRVKKGSWRRALVIAQFSISIALSLATVVVFNQLSFIRQKSWRPDKDTMLYVPFKENLGSQYGFFRSELLKNPAITAVGAKDCVPTEVNNNTNGVFWDGKTADQNDIYMETSLVDVHYLKTMGMGITAGRGFSADFPGDVGNAYVLNEEAVRKAGIKDPVGKTFRLYRDRGTIVGVVKNTFFQSFRQELRPQVFYLFRDLAAESLDRGVVLIRVQGAGRGAPLADVIARIEKVWKNVNPSAPFEFHFLDQAIDAQYGTERRQGRLFGAFASLAVLISCLGLFGLASFTTEQRTKEIGIRKTLGASIPDIVFLLSRDFSKSVLAANLIAWPVAWYGMHRWLENFAYRTPFSPWFFAASGAAALILSWLTVGLQTFRSARTDPVKALRYE